MKTCILFSGGLDSTYAAFDALSNTMDDVTLVRFDFKTMWGPDWARNQDGEDFCAPRIVEWLRSNIRSVDFKMVPVTTFQYDGWYTTEMALWAADQCQAGVFDRVVTGHNAEVRTVGVGRRALQKALFAHFAKRGSFEFPYINLTKIDILPLMPSELRAMTTSCLRPNITSIGVARCGECTRCKTLLIVERGLEAGLDPVVIREEMFAFILANPIVNRSGDRKVFARFQLWHVMDELSCAPAFGQ